MLKSPMRRLGYIFLALMALVALTALALWPLSQTDMAWTWGGQRLVDFARTRIHGDIEVREVKGNYLTGLHFRGITIRGRKGEVIRASRLDLRLSLWSFVKLQPVIAKLAIYDPHLTLTQYDNGQWNVTNFFRPKPPPPFTVIDFPKIIIKRGEITLTRQGASQHYRDLNLRLILTVLRPKQPDQSILVRQASLAGDTPWGRLGLQTRFTYGSNLLNLLSLVVKKGDRPLVSLGGEVRFHEAEPFCKLLGEVGPIPGKELQRLWRQWPGTWNLGGKFQLAGTPARLQISGEGALPHGEYALQGQIGRQAGEWGYDLGLKLKGFKPAALTGGQGLWGRRLQDVSPLAVQLQLKGSGLSWPPKNLECTLESRPFGYRRAKVEKLRLHLTANGREQRLQGLLKGNFGELKGDATGPLLTALAGKIKIQAEGCQPAIWDLPVAAGTRLNGKFSGNFHLPAHLSGDLEARGQWGEQPLKNLKARLTLNGPKLEIARGQGELGSLTADLKGMVAARAVDLQGKVRLTLDGSWPLLPAKLRGRLSGEGTLKGPWASPRFTLKAQGQRLAWQDFALSKVSLQASGAGWPPAGGRVEIKGTGLKTPAGAFSRAAFLGQGERGRWQLSFNASSAKGLKAEVRGTADLQARPRVLHLSRCRFTSPKVTAVNTSPIQVRFQPGLEIPPAVWRVNDGRLTLQAQTRGRELTAHLEAVDLPANLIHLQGAPLTGKVQGRLDLNGSLEQPAIQARLTWGPGKWGDFSFRRLETTVNYREENLVLKGSVEEKAHGPRLVWDGHIPLKLSFSPLKWGWGDQDLNLRVQGENASLALLTALSPEVLEAKGSLSIMAQWQGNPRHPRVSGRVRWGEGKLQFRTAGRAFRLLEGEATLQGEKIVIPDLALESQGMAHIRGAIILAGFKPHRLDLRGNLEDFQALDRGGAVASASGSVSLQGPWSAPLLQGRLQVLKASFRPSFFQTGIHDDIKLIKTKPAKAKTAANEELTVWRNLAMDITLVSPDGARIRDKRLNMILAGTLKARKKPGEPCYVSGVLRSRGGTYELHGRPFKIERGEIHFPGKPHADVTLEGRATHEVSGLTLILNASGPADKPQVRMESIPPLPPSDLLAYLVFGRPAHSLTREEYQTVGQQALGILGGISAQKIKELLGKDFPLVGNVRMKGGQSEGRQTVGIAKPLTKDLTVTFERKSSPLYRDDSNQVRLEYKVNKYLSLESQMGQRNSGGDVLFNLDF